MSECFVKSPVTGKLIRVNNANAQYFVPPANLSSFGDVYSFSSSAEGVDISSLNILLSDVRGVEATYDIYYNMRNRGVIGEGSNCQNIAEFITDSALSSAGIADLSICSLKYIDKIDIEGYTEDLADITISIKYDVSISNSTVIYGFINIYSKDNTLVDTLYISNRSTSDENYSFILSSADLLSIQSASYACLLVVM